MEASSPRTSICLLPTLRTINDGRCCWLPAADEAVPSGERSTELRLLVG